MAKKARRRTRAHSRPTGRDRPAAPRRRPAPATDTSTTGDSLSAVEASLKFVIARNSGDQDSERQVSMWHFSQPETGSDFIATLAGWASAGLVEAYGPGATALIDHLHQDWMRPDHRREQDLHPDLIEGQRLAAALMLHMLREDRLGWHLILEHIGEREAMGWGAAAALSDFLIGSARARWGDATGFIEQLGIGYRGRQANGRTRSPNRRPGPVISAPPQPTPTQTAPTANTPAAVWSNPIIQASSSHDALAETNARDHAVQDAVEAPRISEPPDSSPHNPPGGIGPTPEMFTEALNFLRHRDGGDLESADSILDRLTAIPGHLAGFVSAMETITQLVFVEAYGADAAQQCATFGRAGPRSRGRLIDANAPLSIGYRAAVNLLEDRLANKPTHAQFIHDRIAKDPTMGRGAALGLADLGLGTLRGRLGSATEWLASDRLIQRLV